MMLVARKGAELTVRQVEEIKEWSCDLVVRNLLTRSCT